MQVVESKLFDAVRIGVQWCHITLVLIGIISVIGFARLNFGGDDLTIDFDVVEPLKKGK